jgi:hypothetical protein
MTWHAIEDLCLCTRFVALAYHYNHTSYCSNWYVPTVAVINPLFMSGGTGTLVAGTLLNEPVSQQRTQVSLDNVPDHVPDQTTLWPKRPLYVSSYVWIVHYKWGWTQA